MDLHEFYTRLLLSLNISSNDEGMLSRGLDDESVPYTVKGKRVVMPTSKQLRDPVDGTIVFHPLSENITRGESDVVKSLRDSIMYELTVRTVSLITELSRVAATPSEHKKLDGASGAYLRDVSDMDERIYKLITERILMRISPKPEARLISISLHKTSKEPGVLRAAKFKFPVLEEILSDDMEVLGVKLPSKKAKRVMASIFELVIGDEETRASYDYGSKNQVAPYFHALMMGLSIYATHFNKVVAKHKKALGKDLVEELTFDLSWTEALDNLSDLRRAVPPQEGNEGSIIVAEATVEPEETRTVKSSVAKRMLPKDRAEEVKKAVRDDTPDEEPLAPWEEEPRRGRREEPRRSTGRTLDDYLADRDGGSRRDRYSRSDRRDRYGSRDHYRDEDPRDRFQRNAGYRNRYDGPSFDLGIERSRDLERRYGSSSRRPSF